GWKEEASKHSKFETIPMFVLIGTKSDLRSKEVTISEIKEKSKKWNVKYYIISCIQDNSASLIRRMLYLSVKDFHEHLLLLSHENKKIPEHVTTSYHKKKPEIIDIYDPEKKSFCCYQ
ncbi:unnamed protein product, partial [marine sediment metagenome]